MPITVIRASAGSGKTYQLAISFIRILLAGESAGEPRNPAGILATTFTRAAAGEILNRVLRLIAEAMLSKKERESLAVALGQPLSEEHCARLLASLVGHLDRLAVSTMDSFFGQIAKAFSGDLGFAPDWTMAANESEADLLRRTLHALLDSTDHSSLSSALWTYRGGAVASMLQALRELAPGFAYSIADESAPPDFKKPDVYRWSAADIANAIATLAERNRWVPRNKGDKMPSKRWETAIEKLEAAVQEGVEATSLFSSTLCVKVFKKEEFYNTPIPPELHDALAPLAARASQAKLDAHLAREEALRWVGSHYARHRRTENFTGGTYTFGDVASMVTAAALTCNDLYFRIGTRNEHVLFDEFQDTSRLQFQFFKPIVEEVGANGGDILIVGDEKQAIYGWRGSDRWLMHAPLRELCAQIGKPKEKTLDQSYRSSPAVLRAVNCTFSRLRKPWLDVEGGDILDAAGREWAENFPKHRPAPTVGKLQGRVRLHDVPNDPDGDAETARKALIEKTLALVRDHLNEDPKRKIGILLRKNALMSSLIAGLRQAHPDVDVSGEGGNPLTDSRAVEIILSLFTWLDHPGSSAAIFLVTQSALAPVFGLAAGTRVPPDFTRSLRHRVMESGFAAVIRGWIRDPRFQTACSAHDLQRCEQLLEVAYEFDAQGPTRPSDFVSHVRDRRVERPGGSGVRVMTIHVSKGLEFEAVILVDVDGRAGGPGVNILRNPDGTFHIVPSKEEAPLMGLDALVERNVREGFIEELSVLYVAMTRARSFLDIVLREGGTQPLATLLRAALPPLEASGELTHAGEPYLDKVTEPSNEITDPGISAAVISQPADPAPDFSRTVLVTPSGGKELAAVNVSRIIAPRNRFALVRGDLVHVWLQDIRWIEEGLPDAADLVSRAAVLPGTHGLDRREIAALADAFLKALRNKNSELHAVLSMPALAAGESLDLWRERRFAVVRNNSGRREVINGSFDRVVLWRNKSGKAMRAAIVDYKTDRIASEEDRGAALARHAPQLDAYRTALCLLCPELNSKSVSTAIVFTSF